MNAKEKLLERLNKESGYQIWSHLGGYDWWLWREYTLLEDAESMVAEMRARNDGREYFIVKITREVLDI